MRDQKIDFIKGMLMWCVIYGHTVDALLGGYSHAPVWLHVFVRTFDLPFFMILSGYFLKKSLERRYVWRVALNRITMILVPIVIWTLLRGRINIFGGAYYFLWAVLVSGMMCILCYLMTSWLPHCARKCVEVLVHLLALVLLHFIKLPWNLFYLYPFFVVGYYLRDVSLNLPQMASLAVVVLMAVALCYWSPEYTPWNLGALAWQNDGSALYLYVYRFALAILAVCVVSKIFDAIFILYNGCSIIVRWVTAAGSETLAIYILQTIFVERGLRYIFRIFWDAFSVEYIPCVLSLVGYVIAPIISFFSLGCLYALSRKIKGIPLSQFVFGFKVR